MTIKIKLISLALIILAFNIFLISFSVWTYKENDRKIKILRASIEDLHALRNWRLTVTRQVTQPMMYLLSNNQKDIILYRKLVENAHAALEKWKNAINKSAQLGQDKSRELQHAENLEIKWQEITRLIEKAFLHTNSGENSSAYDLLEYHVEDSMSYALFEEIDRAVTEERDEVHAANHWILMRLGVMPWLAQEGKEQIAAAEFALHNLRFADRVRLTIERMHRELLDYIYSGSDIEQQEFNQYAGAIEIALTDWSGKLQTSGHYKEKSDMRPLVETVRKNYNNYFNYASNFISIKSGNNVEILKSIKSGNEIIRHPNKLLEQVEVIIEQSQQMISDSQKNLRKAIYESVVQWNLILTLVSVLFVFFLVITLKGILNSLHRLRVGTEHISKGQLDYRINLQTQDEFGKLAGAFDSMIEALQKSRNDILETKNYTENILRSMNEALFVITRTGIIQTANSATYSLLGYSIENFVGRSLSDIFVEDQSGKEKQSLEEILTKDIGSTEKVFKTADQRKIHVFFSWQTVDDNAGIGDGYVCLAQDITKRKKDEALLLDSEKKLRLLSNKILNAQESERKRIAAELHDELGQSLSFMKLRLGSLKKKLPEEHEPFRMNCDEMINDVDQILNGVRTLIKDLTPPLLEDLGLTPALRKLFEEFTKHFNAETLVDIDHVDDEFVLETKVIIYRIVQEALTNIIKHSQATEVAINVKRLQQSISFSIVDNGKGFEFPSISADSSSEGGIGLTAMGERARMIGASFEVRSQKGTGTRVCFTIPIGDDSENIGNS